MFGRKSVMCARFLTPTFAHPLPYSPSPPPPHPTPVASNAKAFRKVTPASAKRRVRIFVGVMSAYQVLSMLGGALGLYGLSVASLLTLVTCVAIVVVYVTASCKLQSVLEATMEGSAGGGGGTNTTSTGRSRATSSSTRSILAHTTSWVRKNSGAKGQKRHKHLATIMKAARGIVVCFVFYIIGAVGFGTIPPGFARTSCMLILFSMQICADFVLLRYYRAAIMSGATRRQGSNTTAGGTSDNNTVTSVVPASAASTVGGETKNSFTESSISSTEMPSSASGSTDIVVAPGLPGAVNAPNTPTTALRLLIDGP